MTEPKPTAENLPAQSTRATAAQAARLGNLSAIIGRIIEAVDEETAAIRSGVGFDLKSANARKSRYLYELTRATKGIEDGEVLAEHRESLERLRDRLTVNESVIRAHMGAVSEVAKLMQTVIQRAEADGTYSEGEFGWAR
ncbi:hypothetical protein M2281_004012 [Mesorhizobium soli]|jgi:hypothetical protein|uniref:hypothetical protein n=1 Tax=Pseudaminobacter soli (ex Li et al. 2025) TaxID=1295366 RepID=UPI002475BE44|nr:hypothetical protein [Mesorhizobium soli]MDH6233401.1 hypothetical protein [Mesorhizobium soli]